MIAILPIVINCVFLIVPIVSETAHRQVAPFSISLFFFVNKFFGKRFRYGNSNFFTFRHLYFFQRFNYTLRKSGSDCSSHIKPSFFIVNIACFIKQLFSC